MLLSRDSILKASDIEVEYVEVPEWKGSVKVTGLTGTEKSDYEATLFKQKGKDVEMNMKNAMVKLVVLTCIDEEGNKIFQRADVEALGAKSGKAISKVYKVAAKLSGLTDDDIKELTENLSETPDDTFASN